MKYLIFGSTGVLGSELVKQLVSMEGTDVVGLTRSDCDIRDSDQIETVLSKHKPDIVVNCAALTDVDWCENNVSESERVNQYAPFHIYQQLRNILPQSVFIHISTSAIFAEQGMVYPLSDSFKTVNRYSYHKKMSDERLSYEINNTFNANISLIRIGWLFSNNPRDKKFLSQLPQLFKDKDRLEVVSDSFGQVINVETLTEFIIHVAEHRYTGIWHAAAPDSNSRYELVKFAADYYRKKYGKNVEVVPVLSSKFNLPAKRPMVENMDVSTTQRALGFNFPLSSSQIVKYL